MLQQFHCCYCKCAISQTQFARKPYCDAAQCQRAHIQANQQRTLQLKNELLASEDSPQPALSTEEAFLVPANLNIEKKLTKKRKKAFLQHVSNIFEAIAKNQPWQDFPYALSECSAAEPISATTDTAALGQACATCRGACCLQGQNHAFQDKASLTLFLAGQPNIQTKQELLAQYAAFFPERSCQHGCVFQAAMGCTLPRTMRSVTCNSYSCPSLTSIEQSIAERKHKQILVGAVHQATLIRSRKIAIKLLLP